MAKHLIFLVHGMGNHNAGWSKDTQTTIRTLYDSYDKFKGTVRFEDRFEFREVVYNDEFEKYRKRWKDDAEVILNAFPNVAGLPRKLVDLPAGVGKDNFFTTHILDVIMYRFLSLIGEPVRVSVWAQIMRELNAMPKHMQFEWSIIAHSLGTSVIHDALQKGYSTSLKDKQGNVVEPFDVRPSLIAMIANVSRVLEDTQLIADVYESKVHPSIDPAKGLCDYFINAHHQWDPFTLPKPFRPHDDWPDAETHADNRFIDVRINAFEEANIHDLNHYLRNPAVHIELFSTLVGTELSLKDKADAIALYESRTPLGKFDAVREKLKKIRPNDENVSWAEIIEAFVKYFDAIK